MSTINFKVEVKNTGKTTIFIAGKLYKQADTIEELCDAFIAVPSDRKSGEFPHRIVECEFQYANKDRYEVYGAIWTDKGLIYVAKLNKKGEFELI